LEQLFELNINAQISPEAAGAGFAIAIALAKKYNGQETSSIQVLRQAGVPFTKEEEMDTKEQKPNKTAESQEAKPSESRSIDELYQMVVKTYANQSEGWKKRNLFERQWVFRDFKKTTGLSIDEMHTTLKALEINLKTKASISEFMEPLNQLASYYLHQQEQLKGFEKNPQKLEENLRIIDSWVKDVKDLANALKS